MRWIAVAVAVLASACGSPLTGSPAATVTPGHLHGHVVVAPCRPVERPSDPPCPPAAGLRVDAGSRFSTLTDSAGDYALTLPPGDYDVVVEAGIARRPVHVRLAAAQDLRLDFNIDSGIR